MKFGKLLLVGATAFVTLSATAQEENRECDRMRLIAGEAVKVSDFKKATTFYLKGEVICGGYDKANWERMTQSISNVIIETTAEADAEIKKAYIDTLLAAYDRMETAGFYDINLDLERAVYILQSSNPDNKKADKYFQRAIKTLGVSTPESYLTYSYYVTYLIYYAAEGEEKTALKKRMINDYFDMSELITKAGMSPSAQEQMTSYLKLVIEKCEDLLPEIDGYIKALPEDKELGILGVKRMLGLLENMQCTDNKDHKALIEAWLKLDPSSLEARIKLLEYLDGNEAIRMIDEMMSLTSDPEQKNQLQYQKAYIQFKNGSYQAAYASGKACGGKYRADGLFIAAKCVAATANSCGDSTFERKCNYIYAAQLADQAGQSGTAASYRAKAPSSSDCFNENNPHSVTLVCWGVTVNPCP